MRFLLGTHRPNWLERLDVPLFVSHRTLGPRKRLPVARAGWALDSGAFSELSAHGRWTTSVSEYVDAVARYQAEIGQLQWAAPMDWMCGAVHHLEERSDCRSVQHQERTVRQLPPKLTPTRGRSSRCCCRAGDASSDYEACVELYASAGVDLTAVPVVGVGSVCRRQGTWDIGRVMATLSGMGIRLHGFGVKKQGLVLCARYLTSADSMAWSYRARHDWPLPGCTHRRCANCSRYALRWRDELLAPSAQMELAA